MAIDQKLLDPKGCSKERYKFLSDNCIKLAEFLETLPDSQHDQRVWATKSHCGTVGCALGWAAQIGMLEDLELENGPWNLKHPAAGWMHAGNAYFGNQATNEIFLNVDRNRIDTINALYNEARRLCSLTKPTVASTGIVQFR